MIPSPLSMGARSSSRPGRVARRAGFAAAAALLTAARAAAAPPAEVPPTGRAVLYPDTVLVEAGAAACVIVHPAEDPAAAVRLADGLRARYGVPFPLTPDTGVCPARAAPVSEPYQGQHLILLGNVYHNRAILPLYAGFWCGADGAYPGGDGYVLRTVSNPWGTGKNAVLLGASTPAGVDRAVTAFLGRLPDPVNGRAVLSRLLKVAPGGDMVGIVTALAARAEGEIRYPANLYHEPVDAFSEPAFCYHWTGDRRWAERARKILLHIDAQYDQGYYSTSHYRFERFFRAWDILEESGVFSEEEVQRIARRMVDTAYRAPDCQLRGPARHGGDRHITARWMSAFVASDYIRRTFPDAPVLREQAAEWRRWADETFAHAVTGRDSEDRYSSQDVAEMFLRWSLLAGQPGYFQTGMAREAFVFFLNYFDPLGYSCGLADYGDAMPECVYSRNNGVRYQVNLLGYVYDDPRCAWLARHVPVAGWGRTYFGPNVFGSATGGYGYEGNECHFEPPAGRWPDAAAPDYFVGMTALPVDARRHAEQAAKTSGMPPPGEALDKVWFRSGFDRADAYLVLQGLQSFGDANCIPRYVDRGQVWLFHNTQEYGTFYRNGLYASDGVNIEEAAPAYACRADNLARFDAVSLSRSTAPPKQGMRWTRTVVWMPTRWFLVLDHAALRADGPRTVTCSWRLLHPGTWEQDRFLRAAAGGAEFHLKSAAPVDATARQWDRLESSACPFFLRQTQAGTYRAGDVVDFQNLLYTLDGGDPRGFEPVRIDPWTVLVRGSDGTATLAGIGTGSPNALGLAANPECVYVADGHRLYLSNARRVVFGDLTVWASEAPMTAVLSLEDGRGRPGHDAWALFNAAARWALAPPETEMPRLAGDTASATAWLRDALGRVGAPLPYPRVGAAPGARPAAGTRRLVETARHARALAVPRAMRGLRLKSAQVIGNLALALDGIKEPILRSVLTWPAGVRPTVRVAWAKPERIREVVFSFYGWPEEPKTFLDPKPRPPLDVTPGEQAGGPVYQAPQRRFQVYKISNKGEANRLGCLALDLDGLETTALSVPLPFPVSGYANLKELEVLAEDETGAMPDDLEIADLDGDGTPEILVAFQDARGQGVLKLLDGQAAERWSIRADGAFTRAVAADVDGDGRKEVLATAADYSVRLLAADGAVRWERTLSGLTRASGGRQWVLGEVPTGIGLWTPKPGLARIVVGGYCHMALLDPASGEIVGNLPFSNSRYVWKVLERQPDLDGDGLREVVLLHWLNDREPGDANIVRMTPEGGLSAFCYSMMIPDGRYAADVSDGIAPFLSVIGPRGFGVFRTDPALAGRSRYELPVWRQIYTRPISAGALADLDGDGCLDFLVGGEDGFLSVFGGADGAVRTVTALGQPVSDVLVFGAGGESLIVVNTGSNVRFFDREMNAAGQADGAFLRLAKLRDRGADRTLAAFGRDGSLTILRVE